MQAKQITIGVAGGLERMRYVTLLLRADAMRRRGPKTTKPTNRHVAGKTLSHKEQKP